MGHCAADLRLQRHGLPAGHEGGIDVDDDIRLVHRRGQDPSLGIGGDLWDLLIREREDTEAERWRHGGGTGTCAEGAKQRAAGR